MVFGTLQTIIAVLLIGYVRPLILSLALTVVSMVIIGLEISIMSDFSMWWLITIQVMAGEAIVLFGIAYPLSFLLKKSKSFMRIIKLS